MPFCQCLEKEWDWQGDRVILYILETVQESSCHVRLRIGAVHCVVFGGFSPDSLASRIDDSQAKLVITADQGMRGGKTIPLKENVDAALTGWNIFCRENDCGASDRHPVPR